MPNIKVFTVIGLVLVLSACASKKPQTLEDLQYRRSLRLEYSQRLYEGVTQDQLFQAVQKVFQHLDPSDVAFDLRDDRLLVSRSWLVYAILSYSDGREFYEIVSEEGPDGIMLSIRATEMNSLGAAFGGTYPSFVEDIDVAGTMSGTGGGISYYFSADDYNLLHEQISYFLGETDKWFTCKDVKSRRIEKDAKSVICEDSAGYAYRDPRLAKSSK